MARNFDVKKEWKQFLEFLVASPKCTKPVAESVIYALQEISRLEERIKTLEEKRIGIDMDALMKAIKVELENNKVDPRFISYNVIDLQKAEDVIRKVLVTTLKGNK